MRHFVNILWTTLIDNFKVDEGKDKLAPVKTLNNSKCLNRFKLPFVTYYWCTKTTQKVGNRTKHDGT